MEGGLVELGFDEPFFVLVFEQPFGHHVAEFAGGKFWRDGARNRSPGDKTQGDGVLGQSGGDILGGMRSQFAASIHPGFSKQGIPVISPG